ncbi:MAG TPA: histidine--tRNA ligase [Kofleriaceae bacterium]|nr:histidine--tRNA ligase [Kofleriaceae bacterium]
MAQGHALSGFPEWLPEQELVQQHLIGIVRTQYELHGFTPITTRSVESLDDLLAKGETDKEIYTLQRLAPDGDHESRLGLHYDLTVPFARYVVENQGRLTFPFRRYQIQSAWRGERPQLGRYREFLQADVDIIGQGSLEVRYDAELIAILRDTLQAMPLPAVKLLVNNRKLLEGFYRGLGIDDIAGTLRVVDKLPKVGAAGVRGLLTGAGLAGEQADACLGLAGLECATPAELAKIAALGVRHELLDRGVDELAAVMTRCPAAGRVAVVGALHIARGFDYYTGTVVEGVLADHPELGAICSGGRYDNLASRGSKTALPGVGVSIGITRIMGYCEHLGLLKQSRRTPAQVLVVVHDEASRDRSDEVARRLRGRGVRCIVADAATAYGKQIRSAERLGIPYVWFPPREGEAHEVKDIRSGAQAAADPDGWTPAADAALFAAS